MRKRKNVFWTPSKIDGAFSSLRHELGRVPTNDEFINKYSGAMKSIRRGIFSGINSWNDYLISKGYDKWNIDVENVDSLYSELKQELGRIPNGTEFSKKSCGAYAFIVRRKYRPSIKNYNQFVQFKEGKPATPFKLSWNPERVNEVFYEHKSQLERVPTFREFAKKNKGALRMILEGRYNFSVRTWNGFLESLGEKNPKKEKGFLGVLETILEGGNENA